MRSIHRPGLSTNHLNQIRALATLPERQRRAGRDPALPGRVQRLGNRHPGEQRTPGTVKSWLHRARAALAAGAHRPAGGQEPCLTATRSSATLRSSDDDRSGMDPPTPGFHTARRRARERRRNRLGAVAAVAVLAVAIPLAAVNAEPGTSNRCPRQRHTPARRKTDPTRRSSPPVGQARSGRTHKPLGRRASTGRGPQQMPQTVRRHSATGSLTSAKSYRRSGRCRSRHTDVDGDGGTGAGGHRHLRCGRSRARSMVVALQLHGPCARTGCSAPCCARGRPWPVSSAYVRCPPAAMAR